VEDERTLATRRVCDVVSGGGECVEKLQIGTSTNSLRSLECFLADQVAERIAIGLCHDSAWRVARRFQTLLRATWQESWGRIFESWGMGRRDDATRHQEAWNTHG